jgi:hypothetical protein
MAAATKYVVRRPVGAVQDEVDLATVREMVPKMDRQRHVDAHLRPLLQDRSIGG